MSTKGEYIKCNYCGYVWIPRSGVPKYCSVCKQEIKKYGVS
jgi:rubrerythrin